MTVSGPDRQLLGLHPAQQGFAADEAFYLVGGELAEPPKLPPLRAGQVWRDQDVRQPQE